ncbi:MAG: hypothetical protein K2N84_02890, partial [Clostridia bacterium]|nr:hypothetical protein [Clostridia bacterium]
YGNGTLTITPQNLRITVKDYTVEYNGKAIPQEALKEQLVLFDAFTADDFELVMSGKEYKNAGEYSLSAKPYVNEHPQNEQEAQDEAERKNLFKNYKIDIVPGKVTILPKTITVTMKNKETSFNGKGIVASDISVADDISVPDTEKDVTFKVLGTTLEGVKNVGEYSYTAEVVALNGDGTVSSNYTVRSQAGMWKITPVKVKVKSNGTISKVYDGKPIEIAPSKLTLDFEGTDFQSGNYSVLSVDYDKTVRSACVGGEIDLSNVRIRDNTTGQECFNFVATGKVKVTVTKRALNISIGSITVKEGTSETEINNLVTMGGGYYNLIGLADGDNAVIVLVATRWNQDSPDLYIMVDEITIIDKFNVNINDMYDFSAIEEVMGSVFFI